MCKEAEEVYVCVLLLLCVCVLNYCMLSLCGVNVKFVFVGVKLMYVKFVCVCKFV